MEPLFFKAENGGECLFPIKVALASMEPLFFKAENVRRHKRLVQSVSRLQWSRFFSKRKMYTPEVISVEPLELASMEPLFFKAENRLQSHQ